MGWYPALLIASALLGAVCAGFILAQSPRERATQLAALLVGAAAWWSLCEAQWNAAPDAAAAQVWMRLSTPGWAFLAAILCHGAGRGHELPRAPARRVTDRRAAAGGQAASPPASSPAGAPRGAVWVGTRSRVSTACGARTKESTPAATRTNPAS